MKKNDGKEFETQREETAASDYMDWKRRASRFFGDFRLNMARRREAFS